MENKHTRGPWKVKKSKSKSALNIVGTVPGCRYKIARCPIEDYGFYQEENEREVIEVKANAKLMSAAPDLLEAGRLMIERFEGLVGLGEIKDKITVDAMLKAIKKATE